jgi:hypothetical protein
MIAILLVATISIVFLMTLSNTINASTGQQILADTRTNTISSSVDPEVFKLMLSAAQSKVDSTSNHRIFN